MEHFLTYFKALQAANLAAITEHSLRPELKTLLMGIAKEVDPKITILHEGKREGQFGAPDFKVTRIENIIGYVENKKIAEDLEQTLKSEQIKKYQQLSNNILLTNYLDWIWLHNGATQRATLCTPADLAQKQTALNREQAAAVTQLIAGFCSSAPEGIGKPKELAKALALRGKLQRLYLTPRYFRNLREQYRYFANRFYRYLIFLQVGCFYEFYGQQAIRAKQVLGLTLIAPKFGFRRRCGIGVKALERYVALAVQHGYPVVVVNQTGYELPHVAERRIAVKYVPGMKGAKIWGKR